MTDLTSVIGRLCVFKSGPGLYDYELTCDGQSLLSGDGFGSIREAIQAAADITGPITALEVAYGGITAGTFTLYQLRASAEQIAQHAVGTYAAVTS